MFLINREDECFENTLYLKMLSDFVFLNLQ